MDDGVSAIEPLCIFCDTADGVTVSCDGSGRAFNVCGWCWAHVLKGGVMPDDVETFKVPIRRWLATAIELRAWRKANGRDDLGAGVQ